MLPILNTHYCFICYILTLCHFTVENEPISCYALTRKQKAKEKRSRQSDVRYDLENIDVMLGSYPGENYEEQGQKNEIEIDSRSNRQDQDLFCDAGEFMSYLNTILSQNSGLTVETS